MKLVVLGVAMRVLGLNSYRPVVSKARLLLIVLICASPIVLLFDGPVMDGLVAGVAAAGIAVVSRTMRPGEATFFLSTVRPVAVSAAIPALWMVVQVLPLRALANPFWTSAEVAIGHPLAGAISINIGATVLALGQYLTIAAIAFWSAAVAVDRQRAEWILFALVAATALISVVLVANDLFGLSVLSPNAALFDRMQAVDCATLGAIIAAAAAVRTLERYETRHTSPDRSVPLLGATFVACAAALTVCIAAGFVSASRGALIAATYGVATLVVLVVIRRMRLGPWGVAAFAIPAIILTGFLMAAGAGVRTTSFTLAFAAEAPASLTHTSQRILDDVPLLGTGVGTFAAIAPIYGDVDEPVALSTAPSAAATLAIELGRPGFWLVAVTVIGAIGGLFRAALQRGRDSFYAMAGAGCLVTLLFLGFVNAGTLGTAAAMIAAAALGLAFAQSKSRTVQQ